MASLSSVCPQAVASLAPQGLAPLSPTDHGPTPSPLSVATLPPHRLVPYCLPTGCAPPAPTGATLRRAFQPLGFEVVEYVDFSSSEMLRVLTFARDRVKEFHDVFACAILSHGHLGEIIGYSTVQ